MALSRRLRRVAIRAGVGAVDAGFYSAHNHRRGLQRLPPWASTAHYALLGQWQGLDPNAAFDSGFAWVSAAGRVPRRSRSAWRALTGHMAGDSTRFHPLQIGEPQGFDMPPDTSSPVLRLVEGMMADDAQRVIHPCLAADGPVRVEDVAVLFEEITSARLGDRPRVRRDLDVLFINGDRHCPPCTQYRVLNPARCLGDAGMDVCVVDAGDLHQLAGCDLRARVVVVFRALPSPDLLFWIDQLRDGGSTLVFDVDDLLFDGPRPLGSLQTGSALDIRIDVPSADEGRRAMRGVGSLCDFHWFPTAPLAAAMDAEGVSASSPVLPSFLSADQLLVADEIARRRRVNREELVIGYSSGSATHAADFAVAVPALFALMESQPRVRLSVFGPMDLTSFAIPDHLRARITQDASLTHRWDKLMERMASLDISIVPLEDDNGYCESKSEVKYLEASSVGVPTVASAIPAYERALDGGRTGLLVRSPRDWPAALARLVADGHDRRALGALARADVAARYGPTGEFARRYVDQVTSLLEAGAPSSGTDEGWPWTELAHPPVAAAHRDASGVLVLVGSSTSAAPRVSPEDLLRWIEEEWPSCATASVAMTDAALGRARSLASRCWFPGCSWVDLATALRRSPVIVLDADEVIEPFAALLRGTGATVRAMSDDGVLPGHS